MTSGTLDAMTKVRMTKVSMAVNHPTFSAAKLTPPSRSRATTLATLCKTGCFTEEDQDWRPRWSPGLQTAQKKDYFLKCFDENDLAKY